MLTRLLSQTDELNLMLAMFPRTIWWHCWKAWHQYATTACVTTQHLSLQPSLWSLGLLGPTPRPLWVWIATWSNPVVALSSPISCTRFQCSRRRSVMCRALKCQSTFWTRGKACWAFCPKYCPRCLQCGELGTRKELIRPASGYHLSVHWIWWAVQR